MPKGKWILRDMRVRWWCRNCWQKGLCDISVHKITDTAVAIADIKRSIDITCHTNCKLPDIRFNHETKEN